MIKIDKKGKRIEVRSDTVLPGLRTTVPGAYQSTSGHWTVPLSIESYQLLQGKYGDRLQVGNELKRWINGVRERRTSMAKLANSEDAKLIRLPKVAPKLYSAMHKRKYQRVGTRFIADNHATLVADDPGLGKTLMAMGGILEADIPGPYLVVAPKTASESVWQREIQRWLPKDYRAVTLPEFRYQREQRINLTRYTDKTWLIIHPEIALVQAWWICQEIVEKKRKRQGKVVYKKGPCNRKTVLGNTQQKKLACGHIRDKKTLTEIKIGYPKLFQIEWGAIILDESHESLIRRSGAPTQRRRGLDMLRVRGDGMKLAMSGTPFNSKPHQLWGTLNWLDSKTYSAFYRWAELYWQKGGYTGFQIGEFRADREKMLWSSLDSIALRRTKGEVAKDLPPKTHVGSLLDPSDKDSPVGIWLPMEGKQESAYRQMEELSVAELESGRIEAVTALSELTRLKQLACSFGDIEEKLVRVRCTTLMKRYPNIYTKKCRSCRRDGYHEELQRNYIPHLPSNKFDWIVESLEEWGYPKNPIDKVVIVSFYTGILRMMAKGIHQHFKIQSGNAPLVTGISGKTPSQLRRPILDRFNSKGGPSIMMLNVKAGGTAITIDSADRMIFISETRIPDQQKQAEDRIHRISNPRHCMYYYLRSLGTVDIGTALTNQEMDKESHRLLDARRGVDYMRQIMELSRS